VLGSAGLLAYNWWAVVAIAGWLPSVDSLFSEVSADGQPHSALLQRLDVVAGALLAAALLVRGPLGPSRPARVARAGLLLWAAAAGIGGLVPFACAPTTAEGCRYAERHLQLAAHHYLHMVTGVGEFVGASAAVVAATRIVPLARLARVLTAVLAVAYPLLGVAYLSERLGSLVEPVFFVTFSVIAGAVLIVGEPRASSTGLRPR
jgi:hypothetical protein